MGCGQNVIQILNNDFKKVFRNNFIEEFHTERISYRKNFIKMCSVSADPFTGLDRLSPHDSRQVKQ